MERPRAGTDFGEDGLHELLGQYLERVEAGEPLELEDWLAEHPDEAQELRGLHASWRTARAVLDPLVESNVLGSEDFEGLTRALRSSEDEQRLGETLARLREGIGPGERYDLQGAVGSGGMGEVRLVRDRYLFRTLAMKTLRAEREKDSRSLARFVQEAQLTAQLDHPGIVPVHELGADGQGRVYFTMKLVRGRPLSTVFALARAEQQGWSLVRALSVLQRVCEAMAYAHSKGVVHRDLKPSNVMVGRFGEVHVMDWGLARVLDERDEHDRRDAEGDLERSAEVLTSRCAGRKEPSPLITAEGQVLGTPCYMSPEQAAGRAPEIGPLSDVYAVGAMLYHLLGGRPPYLEAGKDSSAYAVLGRLVAGPPIPLERLAPGAPAELVSIAQAAMSRRPEDRYLTMQDLAEDLRAYLENRVVRRHQRGPLIELKKWCARNRGAASLACALLVVLLGSAALVAGQKSVAAAQERSARLAQQRLLDERTAEALVREARAGWALDARSLPVLDRWLEAVEDLAGRAEGYRVELAALRAGAAEHTEAERRRDREQHPLADDVLRMRHWIEAMRTDLETEQGRLDDPELGAEARRSIGILEAEIAELEAELAACEPLLEARRTWRFASPEATERHGRLAPLVEHLDALLVGESALLGRARGLREQAASLERRTVGEQAERWEQAIRSIADPSQCPLYEGLRIQPQVGLVPLGRDAGSGLWEFLHQPTGEAPGRRGDGELEVGPETGIVLVLIPGGRTSVGAQNEDPGEARYVDRALLQEVPVIEVELEPYFISKYELTQAQWKRMTGSNPSTYRPGTRHRYSPRVSATHPVEQVSWHDAVEILERFGLRLPTETQWEHAARAGADTLFWFGNELDAERPQFNHSDRLHKLATGRDPDYRDLADGYGLHAPVDAYEPNAFGLYQVHGNVAEWCADWFVGDRTRTTLRPGDGLTLPISAFERALRGGSWQYPDWAARLSYRNRTLPTATGQEVGVRPARHLVVDQPAGHDPAAATSSVIEASQ